MNKTLLAVAIALALTACGQPVSQTNAPIVDAGDAPVVQPAQQVQAQPAPVAQAAPQQETNYAGMAAAAGAGYLLGQALNDRNDHYYAPRTETRVIERTIIKEVPAKSGIKYTPAPVKKPSIVASKPAPVAASKPASRSYSSFSRSSSSSRSSGYRSSFGSSSRSSFSSGRR